MSLTAGTRLGPYEIVSALGAGGMGEVYRARDTKLNRAVAIKILPEAFLTDPDRVARFEREAQILAALNHPHIAAVHGLEESAGVHALVMEFVDGESLAARIEGLKSKGLGLDEALRLARQIGDALEAAHDKGIVHRDLKPANIMLTLDGQVKVLDFGLAKQEVGEAGASSGPGGATHSPTLTFAATQAGMILGTAAYMSPEQARGRAADKRSDVWAFGCVLYEMLAGKRAFDGEDALAMIAAVVRGEPDWSLLPAAVPPAIRTILKRCLEKDRKARIPDMSVVRFLIADAESARDAMVTVAPKMPARRATMIAGAGVVGVLAGAIASVLMRAPAAKLPPVRFALSAHEGQTLAVNTASRDLAISPDGTHLVYVAAAQGATQLMVRAIDQLDPTPLPDTASARSPFVSPDSHWIGFFTATELKKVAMTGGPSIALCKIAGAPRGASWGPDDTIIFATSATNSGLLSVPAGGGDPKLLTTVDLKQEENGHIAPSVLPSGRAVLFTIIPAGNPQNSQVAVQDLKTRARKTLIRGGSFAEYVETGHLVYGTAGTLRAIRFDPSRLEVLGDPVPVVEQVQTTDVTGAPEFAISRQGTLAYVPGPAGGSSGSVRSLVWVNRQGREELIKGAPPRAYVYPRLSPDGRRVALDIRDQENDIWILDFARETLTRFTFDPRNDFYPVWTPDGKRIIYTSTAGNSGDLKSLSADGTGTAQALTTGASVVAYSISPDATTLVVRDTSQTTGQDLGIVRLGGPGGNARVEPLIRTVFNESNGEFSPDGRWLAYQSNESGKDQIYVRPFPNVNGGRSQISTAGGTRPLWARNGRELFYFDLDGVLMAVPIAAGTNFTVGSPVKLLDPKYFAGTPGTAGRTYDVSPDGERFLMIKDNASGTQAPTVANIVVVLNWFEELKARLPLK